MTLAFACLVAWLVGGIPFGLVLVRVMLGVDIRTLGSGNVGATNASRAFSGRWRLPVFLLIYVLDFAKGLLPTLWFPGWFGVAPTVGSQVLIGAAAVIGHCASPYLRLKGGKGVATTTGVFAAVEPVALLVALATFGVVFGITRQVFFGSLALGIALALTTVFRDLDTAFAARWPASALAIVAALFLVWTHRSNLAKWRAARRGGAA